MICSLCSHRSFASDIASMTACRCSSHSAQPFPVARGREPVDRANGEPSVGLVSGVFIALIHVRAAAHLRRSPTSEPLLLGMPRVSSLSSLPDVPRDLLLRVPYLSYHSIS